MTGDASETPVPADPQSKVEVKQGELLPPIEKALVSAPSTMPLAPERRSPLRRRSRWRALALLALAVIGAGGSVAYWRYSHRDGLPMGIASGNGRIEADEIDIDTKFAGSVAELLAEEGDMVKAGQVVARMDTRDIEASLRKSQAQVQESQRSLDEAHANVEQQKTQVTLAQQEFDRTSTLVGRGFATLELLDQRRQALNGAQATLVAAEDLVGAAQRALDAATHDVELYKVNIADNTLVAPREGRIQYRIANVGEVLPAGGRVYAMLDTSFVYMDIYLPTERAGKVNIGADARIVLDARPDIAIPAKVAFIAAQAQFTPKIVETKEDRDMLMFRIRVRVDPERLRGRAEAVGGGLAGEAYIRFNPATAWPPRLQTNVAK
ncbi:MAG: HlyD family secretion protein [Roseiarcus sp.]